LIRPKKAGGGGGETYFPERRGGGLSGKGSRVRGGRASQGGGKARGHGLVGPGKLSQAPEGGFFADSRDRTGGGAGPGDGGDGGAFCGVVYEKGEVLDEGGPSGPQLSRGDGMKNRGDTSGAGGPGSPGRGR